MRSAFGDGSSVRHADSGTAVFTEVLVGFAHARQVGGQRVDHVFQVDLRGVVDLLSRHLYSSPRVYLRELLQNAVDAITARRALQPECPARIRIELPEITSDGSLRLHDSGIGLTEPQVHELLATIGRSSKRDELGFARSDFLGQFGIGLLSCFLVADEVDVVTRSALGGPTVRWVGRADGRYDVRLVTDPAQARPDVGTTVTLRPRPDLAPWLAGPMVEQLAEHYGSLLPVAVEVAGRRVGSPELPWQRRYATAVERRAGLAAFGERAFGFPPFDVIDVAVPEAGLTGVAYVLPTAANPAARSGHRVYLRRMLLSDDVDRVLPPWAFFVRCVLDTTELRPTAGREDLFDDDLLDQTRRALGDQVRDWLIRLAAVEPLRLQQFLAVHHLGVKALAVHDREMLRIVDRWWPMETSEGPLPTAELRRRHSTIHYTATADEYREFAAICAAQGLGLVNGGYTYDVEILNRLPELDPAVTVHALDPADLAARFDLPDPRTAASLQPFVAAAQAALRSAGCGVVLRAFEPRDMPALHVVSRAAVLADELRGARAVANDLWANVLGAVADPALLGEARSAADGSVAPGPQLVLNLSNPVVQRIVALPPGPLVPLAVQSLYGQALLSGHHPLRPEDSTLLNTSFVGLLDRAISAGATA